MVVFHSTFSWLDFCVPLATCMRARSAGRSSACAPFALRCRSLAFCLPRLKPENVAGLARERLADRIERREADRARLAGLEDREVSQRHSDSVGELGQRHPPVV